MTSEEAKANSQNKVNAIETLCRQFQITVSAEQSITKEGFIKNIVFYTDNEPYNIEDPKQNEEYQPTAEEIASLREQDTPNSVRVRPSDVGSSEGKETGTNNGDIDQGGKHPDSGTTNQGTPENIT